MDSRDLECFITVARCGSINRASNELFMSSQGVGKVLRRLEAELGVTLFVRTKHGVTPTDAGHILLDKAEKLLADIQDIKDNMQAGSPSVMRPLRAVLTYGSQSFLGIEALESFKRAFPSIALDVEDYPDSMVDHALRNGDADVGIIAGPIDTTFYQTNIIAVIHHVIVVNENHPLACKKAIAYSDLNGQSLVMVNRRFQPYHNNLNRLARAGAMPAEIIEVSEIHKISQYAARGSAVGVSVSFEVADLPYPHTRVIPFEDKSCTWDLYLVTPSETKPSTAVVDFRNHLLDWVNQRKAEFADYSEFPTR